MEKLFNDRRDAGRQLGLALMKYEVDHPLVLALPRGGLPVADEVARAIDAHLDIILVRKIGAPDQPELAVAAVVDGESPALVKNDEIVRLLRIDDEYLERRMEETLREIERRRQIYMEGRTPIPITGRTVIVVDDGIATGASVRAVLTAIKRQNPAHLILATPVAPPDVVADLGELADDIVTLYTPSPFLAISPYYREFPQLSDDEVIAILDEAHERENAG